MARVRPATESAQTAIRLAELVGPTVFELAVSDLAGQFLASFDAITLYLGLSPEERPAYASLYSVFKNAYGEFRRVAPEADEDRNCAQADLPPGALVVRFHSRVDAAAVLRLIG